jgi:hypothetical protein
MSNPPAAPATADPLDAQDQARLRNSYVGQLLRRSQLWQRPQFQRRITWAFVTAAVLANLLWMFALDRVMAPLIPVEPDRGPIVVNIIVPPKVFEIPAEPQPLPVEFRKRPSRILIAPPETRTTVPPLTSETDAETRARIGTAGKPALNLFNADGSLRMPTARTRIGAQKIDNPQEAARAEWAEIRNRGENPLDCKKTRFANAFRRDESVGDSVARKYLKWIGLADGAVIAERASAKQQRANEGCDPPD